MDQGGHSRLRIVLLAAAAVASSACQETMTEPGPPLSIQCAANPSAGPAPLSVAFGLDVANALGSLSVSISYGDGSQGSDPDARHVYAAPGDYMASITVSAGAETARCSIPISVAPAQAPTPRPPLENRWPDPSFVTTPPATGSSISGTAPFTVNFNLCRSVDPDGDRLYFRMDLDGDGAYELFGASGADCRHATTYGVGVRTATVCVTDVDCPSWPLCDQAPRLHPFQCRSYSVAANP
jgi:hypothetical protein